MIAGGKIRGNQVVGETGTGMNGALYNFNENRVARTGEAGAANILPDHIAATLLASAGLDPYITRVPPLQALLPGGRRRERSGARPSGGPPSFGPARPRWTSARSRPTARRPPWPGG